MGIFNLINHYKRGEVKLIMIDINDKIPGAKNFKYREFIKSDTAIRLNKAINGSKKSWHCFGCAADIEPLRASVSLLDLLEWIYNNCEFRELIAEFFSEGWVHVAYVEGRNSHKLKLKDKNHNYKIVSLDYVKSLYK
jgi:hypothetical protein